MSTEPTIGVEEAADYLKIDPDTVRERARAGLIPGYKPGRRWVFLRSELLEYLRTTKPCSTAAPTRRTGIADLKSVDRKLGALLGPLPEKQQPNLRIVSGAKHGAK